MGGSAAEIPTPPENQPVPGLRASDAERDQVVGRLRDEFVAGRLSHDTFLHRVNLAFQSRRQAELPPLVADLPARAGRRSLAGWLRGTWSRVTGTAQEAREANAEPKSAGDGRERGARGRVLTAKLSASPGHRQPMPLEFPRGGGNQFRIGRDAGCDLAIPDMSVSRWHAQLERTADGWLLSDLESTNGTRVNGWRVRGKVPVGPGDLVSFGSLDVVFLRRAPE